MSKCRVIRDKNNDIEKILAPNGEDSILYDDILSHLIKMPLEQFNELKDVYKKWQEIKKVPNLGPHNLSYLIYERIRGLVEQGKKFPLDVNGEPIFDSSFFNKSNTKETIKRPSASLESGFTKEVGYRKGKEYSTQQKINLQTAVKKWNKQHGTSYFVPFIQKGQANLFIAGDIQNNSQTLFQKDSPEGIVASEKTLRDIAEQMSDRIGIPFKFISDRTQNFKGKLENGKAIINLAYATLDTPIHEIIGHSLIRAIRNQSSLGQTPINAERTAMGGFKFESNGKDYYKYRNYLKSGEFDYYKNNTSNPITEKEYKDALEQENEYIAKKQQEEIKNVSTLYDNLLKELEEGRGKEVLDRIKKDYTNKESITDNKSNFLPGVYKVGTSNTGYKVFDTREEAQAYLDSPQSPKYSLEEQQEEAIVQLLGEYTAEKLDKVKDGKLISLLKRVLAEVRDFVRKLLNSREINVDSLPENLTLGDLSDILAYSNSKIILPGYEVQYTTPDNSKFSTYSQAIKHVGELTKNSVEPDLKNVKLSQKIERDEPIYNKYGVSLDDFISKAISNGLDNEHILNDIRRLFPNADGEWIHFNYSYGDNWEPEFQGDDSGYTPITTFDSFLEFIEKNHIDLDKEFSEPDALSQFIEKNKQFEQSKEIVEEWKKVNGIEYDPEEIYSRGQGFYSVVGAYSYFDVNLMFQNILHHVEDNQKAGGEFVISAFTKPTDRKIGHLEDGSKIKFVIYPKSNDIKWAANADVYSGSVWDAPDKINKSKQSELLGVSYTKYPSLEQLNAVQPNLADIVDNLAHHHNELGIALNNNFRLEYDETVPYQTKKLINNINKILDQKFGKLEKPKIETSKVAKYIVKDSVWDSEEGLVEDTKEFNTLEEANKFIESRKDFSGQILKIEKYEGKQPTITKDNLNYSLEFYKKRIFDDGKGISDQALINTKISALKEVSKKYPNSLIRSEVVKEKNKGKDLFDSDEFPFQKINKDDNYEKIKQRLFQGKKDVKSSEILNRLQNTPSSPYIAKLAEILNRYNHNDVNIKLLTPEEYSQYLIDNNLKLLPGLSAKNTGGQYSTKTNEIVIVDKPRNKVEAIIEHEIIHSLTKHFLDSDSEFAKEFNQLYKESKELFSEEEQKVYEFTNVHEFLTGALTNSKFQKMLASKPSKYKEYKSKWEEIKSLLKGILTKYLGLTFDEYNLFDHVFSKALDVIENAYQEADDEFQMAVGEPKENEFLEYSLAAFTGETKHQIIEDISKFSKEIEDQLEPEKLAKRTNWIYKQLSGENRGYEKDLNAFERSRDFKEIRELFKDTETGINAHTELVRTLRTAKDDDSIIRKARATAEAVSMIPELSNLILARIKEINTTIAPENQNMNTWFNYIKLLNQYQNALSWVDSLNVYNDNPHEMYNKVKNGLNTIDKAKKAIFDSQRNLLVKFLKDNIGIAPERRIAQINNVIEKEKLSLKSKNPRVVKAAEDSIKELEAYKEQFDFESDDVLNSWLNGEFGDISGMAKAMDSYRDNTNPLIGAFVNATNRQKEEAHRYITHQRTNKDRELAPYYKTIGYGIVDYPRLGKMITFIDDRLGDDGAVKKVLTFLNPFKNYQYDRDGYEKKIYDLKQLKAQGEVYSKEEVPKAILAKIEKLEEEIKAGINKEANEKEWEKLIAPYNIDTKLSAAYLEHALWEAKYMFRDKSDAFYDTYDKLYNDEIGTELKKRRKEITDELKLYKSGIDKGVLNEDDKENIKDLWRQYYSVGNLYKLNGDMKEGIELHVAQRAQQISEANRQHYEYKINTKAFERDKKDITEKYIAQYGENTPEFDDKMKQWVKDNTRSSVKQEYYTQRQALIDELNKYLKLLPNTEMRDFNIGKLYEEIIGQIYGMRDDEGQPIGGDVNENKAEKIKRLQEKIEEIKEKFALFSGLNDVESAKFQELYERKKNGLSTKDFQEYQELLQRSKDNSASKEDKAKIISLFEQLKNISSRVPTEYYVEAFNNVSSLKIDEDGKFDGKDVLESPILETLLEDATFKHWFEKNHFQSEYYDKDAKQKVQKWNRTYQWSRVVPTDPNMMEILPSRAYSYRELKDEYRTDKIEGINVDNKGKFLPKINVKDKKYINEDFLKLENATDAKSQALYNILEIEKKYHLQNQELASSNYDKLWMDVPRVYKNSYERNLSAVKSPISAVKELPGRAKAYYESKSSLASGTGNVEGEAGTNIIQGIKKYLYEDKHKIKTEDRTKIPIAFLEDIPADEVSLNLRENTLLYGESLKSAQVLGSTLAYGKAMKKIFDEHPVVEGTKNTIKETNNRGSSLEYFMNRDYFAAGKAYEFGRTGDKVLTLLKGAAIQEFLGGNFGSIITNLTDGLLSNIVHAGEGRYTLKDYRNSKPLASRILANNVNDYFRAEQGQYSVDTQLKEALEPISEQHILEGLTKGKSPVKWFLSLDWALGIRNKTEDVIQNDIYATYLYVTKVDFNGQTISLADAYEKGPDGIIKLKKGIDSEWEVFTGKKWFQLKQDIAKTVRDFQGGYAKMDKTFMDQYTSWNFFATLKRFFFRKFMNEFGLSTGKVSLRDGVQFEPRWNPQSGADLGFVPSALNGVSRAIFRNFNIHTMTKQEQADTLRILKQIGGIYLLGYIVKHMLGGSYDEKKQTKAVSGLTDREAYFCYQLLRLQNETETLISPSQFHGFIFSFTAATIAGDYIKIFEDIRASTDDVIWGNSKLSQQKKNKKNLVQDVEKVLGLKNIIKPATQPKKQLKGYIKAINHPWQGLH